MTFHVLHVVNSLYESAGGSAVSVCNLAKHVAATGRGTCEILSLAHTRQGDPLDTQPVPLHLYSHCGRLTYGFSAAMWRDLQRKLGQPNTVVHVHSMWRAFGYFASRSAESFDAPHVVSTRGALRPVSFSDKRYRKRLFWELIERRRLERSTFVHATSQQEAAEIVALSKRIPVVVVPNGVSLPTAAHVRKAPSIARRALFLSRIQHNKGLVSLLKAWSHVRPHNWALRVVGSDENGHLGECQRLARTLGITVDFAGPKYGDAKWNEYRSADLFIHPSLSENFGISIAEALGCGLPVIATTGAPWEELVQSKSGWWTEPTSECLAEAIAAATDLTDDERSDMGERGRSLVTSKYTWPGVAHQMATLYERALGVA